MNSGSGIVIEGIESHSGSGSGIVAEGVERVESNSGSGSGSGVVEVISVIKRSLIITIVRGVERRSGIMFNKNKKRSRRRIACLMSKSKHQMDHMGRGSTSTANSLPSPISCLGVFELFASFPICTDRKRRYRSFH